MTPGGLNQSVGRRRSRVVVAVRLCIVLSVALLVVWAGVRVAYAVSDVVIVRGTPYVVKAGDTLWAIAGEQYGVQQHDVRWVVDIIQEANGLSDAGLVPGQRLILPPVQ